MNIDIRKSIINNFKNCTDNDIEDAINSSIKDGDEITLPGLGVFFEILWKNSTKDDHLFIINSIEKGLI